jgi:TolB-like protein
MLGGMIYRFGSFELDIARAELRSDGGPRRLEPQVFALIAFLIEHRERLVSRDEILEKVWDGRVVSDSTLASAVKAARKVIGDDGKSQRFIRTIHGRGFRFVATVTVERERSPAIPAGTGAAGDDPAGWVDTHSRPSIAVLPFQVIGDIGPCAAIAEGLPHELIAELARLRWLFVIARGSSFRLRAADTDVREIGRLLGARYCLTGTVEVTGKGLIVTTELTDTSGGDVVWAERHAGSVDAIHTVRTEIRSTILTSLEIQIPLHEANRARLGVTENLDAWSAYHLGLQHMYRFNRKDNAIAARLFQQSVDQDSGFARAHAGLSFLHFQTAFMRHAADIAGEIAQARACAERGLAIDTLDPFVNFTMGRSYWLEGDLETALVWLERATTLSPNYAQGIYARSWTEAIAGRGRESRRHVDLAMRLSPLDPLYYAMLGTRGFTHMALEEDAEAAYWSERAARSPGAHVLIAMIAAAAQVLAGNQEAASTWARNVRERNPQIACEDFFHAFPMKSESMRLRLAAALRSLGFR